MSYILTVKIAFSREEGRDSKRERGTERKTDGRRERSNYIRRWWTFRLRITWSQLGQSFSLHTAASSLTGL